MLSIQQIIGLIAVLLLCLLAFIGKAQKIMIPPLDEVETIDDIAHPYIANEATKGLSIGIIQDGKIKFLNYGICSEKEPQQPDNQTFYEIGSITKTMTATVLAQMVAEGKVNYNDPISKYLPDDWTNWEDSLAITLEDLATHRSGLPGVPKNIIWSALRNLENPYVNYEEKQLYKFLRKYKPIPKSERKPGYSNLGMGLLGYILAIVDGVPYEEMYRKRIFEPLKMEYTRIEMGDKKLVQGHSDKGRPVSPWDFQSTLGAAGAIRSNTLEMMHYLEANINEEMTFATTHQGRFAYDDIRQIGLAWVVEQDEESAFEIIWHNGGTGGFNTYLGFNKEYKIGVIVLSNTSKSVDLLGIRILQFLAKNE